MSNEENTKPIVDVPEVEIPTVDETTLSNDELDALTKPDVDADHTEFTESKTKPEDDVEPLGLVDFADDSRPVFIENSDVTVNAYYTVFAGGDLNDASSVDKVFPDAENDVRSALSILIGGTVTDHDTYSVKSYDGKVSNIIRGKDKDGVLRESALTKSVPKLNGSALVGKDAILAITSSLGIGGSINLPLVNSGFTIKMDRATGDDFTILDEQLLLNKGEFGRMTVGSAMGFSSSYLQNDITNTLLGLVREHNFEGVKQGDTDGLRKVIKDRDYYGLLVACLAGTNPDGLHTNIPCSSSDDTCNHITTGKTLPARLYHVDHGKLTDRQLEIITRPISEPVTVDDYNDYQADFESIHDYYEFTKGEVTYRFTYQSPTLDNNIRAGIKWASNINKIINRYIIHKDDPIVRRRYVSKALEQNTLSQFGGWFKSIELKNTVTDTRLAIIEDQDTIIDTLKTIYAIDGVAEVLDNIRKFINNSNPVTIGTPNFKCPKCLSSVRPVKDIMVPVDIQSLFFIHSIDQAMMQNHFELTDMIMS